MGRRSIQIIQNKEPLETFLDKQKNCPNIEQFKIKKTTLFLFHYHGILNILALELSRF